MKTLGIDVGTGGTRAVVIDPDGNIVASATADHIPFSSPHTGWAQQDRRLVARDNFRRPRRLIEIIRRRDQGYRLLRTDARFGSP